MYYDKNYAIISVRVHTQFHIKKKKHYYLFIYRISHDNTFIIYLQACIRKRKHYIFCD